MIFAEPFWNVINSDEHYLDLYKYIMPLRDRLEHGQGKSIYLTEVIPNLYEQYEIIQQVFDRAKVLPKTIENFKIVCSSMLTVVKRQLSDHLESGTYGVAPESDLKSKKNIWRLRLLSSVQTKCIFETSFGNKYA